jgi:hypothetical protein
VVVVCSFGIAGVPLLWLVPTPELLWPLALEAAISGTLWAGQGLGAFALPLSISPRHGRPFYLAAFSTASGVAFAAATAVGGSLIERLPSELFIWGHPFWRLQILFLFSAAARLLAAFSALGILEPSARPVPELFRHIYAGAVDLPARLQRAAFGSAESD